MPSIILDSEDRRAHALKVLSLVSLDKPKIVTIDDYREPRSLSANARLWALHSKAAEVTGYSAEEMHEFALCRHFGYADKACGKITRRMPLKRSSTRDKKEFAEFMEATEAWYITDFGAWLE